MYLLLIAGAVFTPVPFVGAAVNSVKTLTETFLLGDFIPFLQFPPILDPWREVAERPADRECLHQQLRHQRWYGHLLGDHRRPSGLFY
jgi:hypothetical protein